MLEKIAAIEARYNELTQLLSENVDDYQRIAALAKERSDIEQIVNKGREYRHLSEQLEEARSLLYSDDAMLRELAANDINEIEPKFETLEIDIKHLLIPKDPRDERNVIMEIRAGTGGEEAALFGSDLFRMYTRYAENQGWGIEVLSQHDTGIGGFKEIVSLVKGKGAYSRLKYESGVHRVQRIPLTEASGRIHTSTVTVAVLAEVEDVDIHLPDNELKIDVYKSAGAGGQSVQKNSTAIRITHLPSGIVVACQDERSQLQNKLRAMRILRARIFEIEERKRQEEQDAKRRAQVGTGERAEKIRTYNYPQSRVTDHRINLSSHNLPAVMEGQLEEFIDELSLQEETERLAMTGMEG